MSLTLTLSGNSSILTADYFPPIDLSQESYVCGLVDFQTYNSIPNVDIDNNIFPFGITSIKTPTGSYEISDIEKYVKTELGISNKPSEKKFLQIRPNNNTLKCEIYSSEEIDFKKEKTIGELLGFSKKKLEPKKLHVSDLFVDINKINIIRVECNIITGTYINGEEAHILHEFSIGVGPGYKIIEVPRNVIYLPVTFKRVSSLTIKFLDQNGRLINFRGETITIRLHLKSEK